MNAGRPFKWMIVSVLVLFGLGLVWRQMDHTPFQAGISQTNPKLSLPDPESSLSEIAKPAATPTDIELRRHDVVPLSRDQWQALPPNELPLAGAYAVLKSRADRGDAPAACRLAAELGHCRNVIHERDVGPSRYQASGGAESPDKMSARKARLAHCSGVDKAWLADEAGYTRQAALAGNLAAMEAYVSGWFFGSDVYASSVYLEDYRREAPRLAEAALQAGSFGILVEYESAFGILAGQNLFSRALGDSWDPEKHRQIALLIAETRPGTKGAGYRKNALVRSDGTSDEKENEALLRQAAERFEMWFQGRKSDFTLGGFGRYPFDGSKVHDFNARCTETYVDRPLEAPPIDWSMP
ncbi:MAG: hypothetical protein IPK97_20235 [Ahniella sp.]|nr:hypothetical protein [Ahniella sp.]